MRRVTVIGGGISGLVCALRLAGRPDTQVILLEEDDRLGGKFHTTGFEGSIVEGGADGFIAWRPQGLQLCRELGIDVVRSAPERSSIIRDGRPQAIPAGIAGALPTKLMPVLRANLLGPSAKLRLLSELLRPRRRDQGDESVGGLVRRRAGGQIWERLVEPLVAGMYAGDGERLSAQSAVPFLVQAERDHGSITRAALIARRKARAAVRAGGTRSGGAAPVFCTAPEGMGAIVDAIAQRLSATAEVRTGEGAHALTRSGSRWRITTTKGVVDADAVVLAAPAFASAELVRATDGVLADELDSIPFADTTVVAFVFASSAVPRDCGLGYVVPRIERSPVVACSISSAKFPQLAAPGHAVVRIFLGRHGDPVETRTDAELAAIARASLAHTVGIDADPLLTRVFRLPAAFPQYVVGHGERVAAILARVAAHPGLFVTGASYEGIGIPDCIGAAERCAAAVSRYLG